MCGFIYYLVSYVLVPQTGSVVTVLKCKWHLQHTQIPSKLHRMHHALITAVINNHCVVWWNTRSYISSHTETVTIRCVCVWPQGTICFLCTLKQNSQTIWHTNLLRQNKQHKNLCLVIFHHIAVIATITCIASGNNMFPTPKQNHYMSICWVRTNNTTVCSMPDTQTFSRSHQGQLVRNWIPCSCWKLPGSCSWLVCQPQYRLQWLLVSINWHFSRVYHTYMHR